MKIAIPYQVLSAEELGHVHFIGIGGAGLSGIARIMLARGITVSGSDAAESKTLDALRALGATCHVGHAAEQVHGADTVVASTAVREDNPEILEAQRLGLRLWPRSAAVESVMRGRKALAVAGTHGKTTTTSLLTVALQHCGVDPSFAIGGELNAAGTNAQNGSGEYFVIEADESDGAFLVYSPYAAVVTNVEADHLDNWGTEEAYRAAFADFLDRIEPGGFLVVCVDDPGAAELGEIARSRGIRTTGVGEAETADLRASDLRFEGTQSFFTVSKGDEVLGQVALQIPGRHYVLDALVALACGLELGLGFDEFAAGLGSFTGTRRRMEFKGAEAGVRVYDSYAHHPGEIGPDLAAARSVAGDGRLVVVFQPHMVSRTKIFGAQMGEALGVADAVVVMDIYLAREVAEEGVSGALVANAVPLPAESVIFEPDAGRIVERVLGFAGPGDLVVTLGAGDVTRLGPEILTALAAR